MSASAIRLPLVTQEVAPIGASGKRPRVSWQQVVVVVSLVTGAVICALAGQETIAAALAGGATGFALNRPRNGKDS
jgi:hypothetical protein